MAEKSTFIKLDRNIVNWRWFKDHNTFKLFTYLLLSVNLADKPWRDIIVKRGQIVTSIKHLAENTGLSEREVRTALNHLKSTSEVTSLSTPQYTVITINNYNDYQSATYQTPNDRQTTDKRPTNDRQQLNNDNNINNNISLSQIANATRDAKKIFGVDEPPYKLASYLANQIIKRIPSKNIQERTIQSWAADMDKINRIDGHPWELIAAVLDFSQQDNFWSTNILSAKKFREKFDQLLLRMKQEEKNDY